MCRVARRATPRRVVSAEPEERRRVVPRAPGVHLGQGVVEPLEEQVVHGRRGATPGDGRRRGGEDQLRGLGVVGDGQGEPLVEGRVPPELVVANHPHNSASWSVEPGTHPSSSRGAAGPGAGPPVRGSGRSSRGCGRWPAGAGRRPPRPAGRWRRPVRSGPRRRPAPTSSIRAADRNSVPGSAPGAPPMTLIPSSIPRWKLAMVTIRLRSATRVTETSMASSVPTVSMAASTPSGDRRLMRSSSPSPYTTGSAPS